MAEVAAQLVQVTPSQQSHIINIIITLQQNNIKNLTIAYHQYHLDSSIPSLS